MLRAQLKDPVLDALFEEWMSKATANELVELGSDLVRRGVKMTFGPSVEGMNIDSAKVVLYQECEDGDDGTLIQPWGPA